jgi:hypothetical protein
LFGLFATLLVSNGDRWSPTLSSRAAATVGSVQAESVARSMRTARISTALSLDEI